jgi:hypothetical protein
VFSTASGTGAEGASFTGTSMAAPMVAGSAALVIQRHPTWTPEQVKAALMNTAGNDLHVNADPGDPGDIYAPNRVGAGRLQVDDALDTDVLAYNADDHGVVSVSFGPVEVSAPTTLQKKIKVENTGNKAHTFAVSYDPIDEVPGVSYSVSPSSVTLAANGSATVTVTLSAPDPTALTKAIDPTTGRIDAVYPYPQETLSDASGRVLLEPTAGGGPDLRVPVYAAPRPASTMTQESSLSLPTGTDTGTLHLTGADLGAPGENGVGNADPDDDIFSIGAGFELAATSGETPECSATVEDGCWRIPEDKAADVKYVGVTSDYPLYEDAADSMAYFAISSHQPYSTPSDQTFYQVEIDVDDDNDPDLVAYNYRFYNGVDPSDVMVSELVDMETGDVIDDELLNGRFGDTDTAAYDSDTLVMPVWLDVLEDYGVTAANPTVNYGVVTFSGYSSQAIDYVGMDPETGDVSLSANLYDPAIQVTDAGGDGPLVEDSTGAPLTVTRNPAAYTAEGGQGILMVHFHNKVGNKAQVVNVVQPATVTGTHLPEPSTFGTASSLKVTVTGSGPSPTGSVTVKEGATVLGSGTLASGTATVTLPANLAVGAHTLSLAYSGDGAYGASTGSATATVTKAPAKATSITAEADPKKIDRGESFDVIATVTASGVTPTGSVEVYKGNKLLGTDTLGADGKVTIKISKKMAKKLKTGKNTLDVKYLGTADFLASQTTVTVKVKKK